MRAGANTNLGHQTKEKSAAPSTCDWVALWLPCYLFSPMSGFLEGWVQESYPPTQLRCNQVTPKASYFSKQVYDTTLLFHETVDRNFESYSITDCLGSCLQLYHLSIWSPHNAPWCSFTPCRRSRLVCRADCGGGGDMMERPSLAGYHSAGAQIRSRRRKWERTEVCKLTG